jgi:hypothetical protein
MSWLLGFLKGEKRESKVWRACDFRGLADGGRREPAGDDHFAWIRPNELRGRRDQPAGESARDKFALPPEAIARATYDVRRLEQFRIEYLGRQP